MSNIIEIPTPLMRRAKPARHVRRRLLRVCFCVNDPDSGAFLGSAYACSVNTLDGEWMFDLVCVNVRGMKFSDTGEAFRLHRKLVPYLARKEWFGNWCWDSYLIERSCAVDLLRTMRATGRWVIDGGALHACTWWESLGVDQASSL